MSEEKPPKSPSSTLTFTLTDSIQSSPDTPTKVSKPRESQIRSLLAQDPEPVWRPSVLKLRPMLGLFAVLASIGCMLASLAVLVVSHNQPVSHWPVQPTVYLAIAAAIANAALGFAAYQAVPVSWWYSMSRGTSIRDLERQWEAGHSLAMALRHNVRMGFAGIATLLVAIQIIDGPLLQRATSVSMAISTQNATLPLKLAQEVPTGFSGAVWDDTITESSAVGQVIDDWKANKAIILDIQPCNGSCTATVRAPGISMANCTSRTWHLTDADYYDVNATWGDFYAHDVDPVYPEGYQNPMFYIYLRPYEYPNTLPRNSEVAVLSTGRLGWQSQADGTVAGQYVQNTCYYVPAVLEYDIAIEDTKATILHHPNQGRTVSLANNTYSNDDQPNLPRHSLDTIDIITLSLDLVVGINASVVLPTNASAGVGWSISSGIQSNNAEFAKYYEQDAGLGFTIADPTSDVVSALNKMMFRAGVYSTSWANLTSLIDEGLPVAQSVQATQQVTQNVYESDLRWFAGAAVLEILAALCLVPLFWGWWTLGGNVKLISPLEVALAFDAPLLKGANSAGGASEVVRKMGEVKVKYGAAPASDGGALRLGVAEHRSVMNPSKGMRFHV